MDRLIFFLNRQGVRIPAIVHISRIVYSYFWENIRKLPQKNKINYTMGIPIFLLSAIEQQFK